MSFLLRKLTKLCVILHAQLFMSGYIYLILRPSKDQIISCDVLIYKTLKLEEGVLIFTHECIFSSINVLIDTHCSLFSSRRADFLHV